MFPKKNNSISNHKIIQTDDDPNLPVPMGTSRSVNPELGDYPQDFTLEIASFLKSLFSELSPAFKDFLAELTPAFRDAATAAAPIIKKAIRDAIIEAVEILSAEDGDALNTRVSGMEKGQTSTKPAYTPQYNRYARGSKKIHRQVVLKHIERMRQQGMTFPEVAEMLNSKGVKTLSNKKTWSGNSVGALYRRHKK